MSKTLMVLVLLVSVLLISTVASVQAQDLTQVYVRIGTGDDDLRGGSELTLNLSRKDGPVVKIQLIQGRRLGDRTTTSRVYPVEPRFPLTSLTGATITWTPGRCDAPCQTDQWWMTDLLIRVGGGPGDPTVKELVERASSANSASGLYPTLTVGETALALPHKFADRDETVSLFTVAAAARCTADRDCDDRVFCNGVERCTPSNSLADARGCIASAAPACNGLLCDEGRQMCGGQSCVDNDGDGHLAMSCGGDDCDDNDATRFPGNVEVFGDNNKDQDCNPNTHGFFSGNTSSIQVCDGRDKVVMVSKQGNDELFARGSCIPGTVCVQQPNGSGVCMTEPPRYQAPSAAVLPTGPQQMPSSSKLSNPNVRNLLNNIPTNAPTGGAKQ